MAEDRPGSARRHLHAGAVRRDVRGVAQEIDGLQLPTWFTTMVWKTYLMTSQFFDKLVYDTREKLEKRGVTTDEEIETAVRELVGGLY